MNNPLPEDLISINNACIDYAYGRTDSVPQDINKLFNWYHEEYLSNVEMISVVCAIDLKKVKEEALEDNYTIDMEGIEPEEINDKIRVSSAKKYLELEIEDSASGNVLQFDTFVLENDQKESACIGALLEYHGPYVGYVLSESYPIEVFKSRDAYIDSLKERLIYIFCDELDNKANSHEISDELILGLWKK